MNKSNRPGENNNSRQDTLAYRNIEERMWGPLGQNNFFSSLLLSFQLCPPFYLPSLLLSPSLFRLDYSHCEPVICCLKYLLSINLVSFCLLLFLLRLCAKNWLRRINASVHLWSYYMFFLNILIGLTKRDWDACLIVFPRAHILFLSVFIQFLFIHFLTHILTTLYLVYLKIA